VVRLRSVEVPVIYVREWIRIANGLLGSLLQPLVISLLSLASNSKGCKRDGRIIISNRDCTREIAALQLRRVIDNKTTCYFEYRYFEYVQKKGETTIFGK